MATFVPFVLVDNGGTGNITVNPASLSNGVAEWVSSGSRSQAYRATASMRLSNQNQKMTFKVEVPKVDTQIVNGVQLPVTAWKSIGDITVSIPAYASDADRALIAKAYIGMFKAGNPANVMITSGQGPW